MQEEDKKPQQIVYSCYYKNTRDGEQFVPEHVLSYQIAGTLNLNTGQQNYLFKDGDFRFVKKNQLIKFNKQPPKDGEFKSLSIYLEQETLKEICIEYDFKIEKHDESNAVIQLKPNKLMFSFIDSLMPYLELNTPINNKLQTLKVKEAVLILLQTNPILKNILFDFTEPGKIDLEGFMHKNFHFNVHLKRFAYLTGRSLATFKRDFEKIFNDSPSHWLQQKRLQEAYFLIKEKGKAVSDVYLDVGFEDLSHFSFAFKNKYGIAPSKI